MAEVAELSEGKSTGGSGKMRVSDLVCIEGVAESFGCTRRRKFLLHCRMAKFVIFWAQMKRGKQHIQASGGHFDGHGMQCEYCRAGRVRRIRGSV